MQACAYCGRSANESELCPTCGFPARGIPLLLYIRSAPHAATEPTDGASVAGAAEISRAEELGTRLASADDERLLLTTMPPHAVRELMEHLTGTQALLLADPEAAPFEEIPTSLFAEPDRKR